MALDADLMEAESGGEPRNAAVHDDHVHTE
jgi:hypothetical protein